MGVIPGGLPLLRLDAVKNEFFGKKFPVSSTRSKTLCDQVLHTHIEGYEADPTENFFL